MRSVQPPRTTPLAGKPAPLSGQVPPESKAHGPLNTARPAPTAGPRLAGSGGAADAFPEGGPRAGAAPGSARPGGSSSGNSAADPLSFAEPW